MKKILLIGFLAISLLLFGCAQDNLPPEPPAPGETGGGAVAGQAIAGGEGYADPTSFTIEFGPWPEGEPKGIQLAVEEQYIYKTGYASLNNGDWVAFEFDQDTIGGSNWISGNAAHFEQLSPLEVGLPEDSNGFVTYACTKTGGVWDCHNNQWMAWQFGVEDMYCYDGAEACPVGYVCDTTCKLESEELPPEPELPPGEIGLGPEMACGTVVTDEETFFLGSIELQYKGADDINSVNPKVKFKNLETGETLERSVLKDHGEATFDLKLEGVTYTFLSASNPTLDDWDAKYMCNLQCNTVVQEDNHILLGGILHRYVSADDLYATSPKVKFKNIQSGETIERSSSEKAVFTFKYQGNTYGFESESDFNVDDYDISLRYPCDGELSCATVISDEGSFVLDGTTFEYKGADKLTATAPKIKFKDLATGETIERSVSTAAVFDYKLQGIAYYFESASNHLVDDWSNKLVYPCD